MARRAVEAASDKQASDIVLLDTRKVCRFADYFVICTGDAERQLRAIYEEVEHSLKEKGVLVHHHEGLIESGWLLLDYGDVIVHIFAALEREYYQLDKLWSKANMLLRIQ
ncbi:ribosome silencing factor [Chloroflexota bacterium]